MTKEQVFELFLKDMKQPLIQMALYRSFRRYADLRDQVVDSYSRKTGIPKEEFYTELALDTAGLR